MSSQSEIITAEIHRLSENNIPFQSILVLDGLPVTLVDDDAMDRIKTDRDNGILIEGQFVSSDSDGKWSASRLDHNGNHVSISGATTMIAYRVALGYRVGRAKRKGRFGSYIPDNSSYVNE